MNSYIRDRGMKKWTSFMLPEHVERLKEVFEEETRESKPILDEQHKQEINRVLYDAFKMQKIVEVTYYSQFKQKQAVGVLQSIQGNSISLSHEENITIHFENLLDIRMR